MTKVDLPRPNVTVNTDANVTDVVISRDGKEKSYSSDGPNEAARTGEIVKKILNDNYTREWLP